MIQKYTKEEQEELSDIIADGIFKGVTNLFLNIAIAVFIIMVMGGVLITGMDWYEDYKIANDPDYVQPILASTGYYFECHYEYLYCDIVIANETGIVDRIPVEACGYQEANAKYELMLIKLENEVDMDRSILWMDCDRQ